MHFARLTVMSIFLSKNKSNTVDYLRQIVKKLMPYFYVGRIENVSDSG